MLVAIIVSAIAVGATVVVGILGYLMDKSGEPAEPEPSREPRAMAGRRGGI